MHLTNNAMNVVSVNSVRTVLMNPPWMNRKRTKRKNLTGLRIIRIHKNRK